MITDFLGGRSGLVRLGETLQFPGMALVFEPEDPIKSLEKSGPLRVRLLIETDKYPFDFKHVAMEWLAKREKADADAEKAALAAERRSDRRLLLWTLIVGAIAAVTGVLAVVEGAIPLIKGS